MGLHHTAHYLRSKGRGNDTMLVHMTPGEVKGLQALALRHGGSLTINPDTGLPEAGFLDQILPVVAAAGLTYLTAGAAAPLLTSALGATGAGIVAGAGAGALISGGMAAIQGKDVGRAALMGGLGGGVAGGMGAYADAPNLLADISQKTAETAGTEVGKELTQKAVEESAKATLNPATGTISTPDVSNVYSGLAGQPTVAPGTMPAGLTTPPPSPPVPTQAGIDAAKLTGQAQIDALNKLDPSASAFGQAPGIDAEQALYRAENLARPTEVGDIYKPITKEAVKTQMPTTFYQDQGTIGRMAIQGLPAIGLLDDTRPQVGPEDGYTSPLQRLSPNFQAYVPPQPNPYYRAQYPRYAAEGGIMQSYQAGGPVERMSMMNTAMNPQGGLYPQGMIDKTQYATPTQRPVSSELMETEPSYQRSNPMLMAEGGEVKGYAAGGKTMLPQFQDLFGSQPTQQNFVNPRGTMSPEMQAYYAQDFANQRERAERLGLSNQPLLPERPTPQVAATPIAQPTGQSMFPGAASMQGGFGQGAPGYPSLTMGSGGFGGGGASGAFPLEGRYGIVKMNVGGVARPLPKGDAGVYRDTDPTTRNQDAFTAALTRMKSMQGRANIKGLPALKAAAKPLGNIEEAASGGVMSSIGGYSDGGRMLKGPGDGMSDSIPGIIGGKQPARLADGEFVVPADVVSHLGNGSTDAGARKLYKMMDKIRKARTGKKKQAPAVKADRYMPA